MKARDTLAELVAINSVSANSNAEIVNYLQLCCEDSGFNVQRFSYTDENQIEKTNLVALAGASFADDLTAELALVGHTDTVPYDPSWTDATHLFEKDGKL